MGGMIPLGDVSRRPARIPVVTALIILVNAVVFVLELMRGEAYVTQWSAIPAQIVSGHHWITILTAMFMHGSWSHIIGNMIFLWAFAPEIEDMRWVGAIPCFLPGWRARGHACPGSSQPPFHSPKPGRERRDRRGDGRVLGHLSSRSDSHGFVYIRVRTDQIHPSRPLNRLLVPHPAVSRRRCGAGADRRGGVLGAHRRLYLRSCHGALVRGASNTFATDRGLIWA